MERKTVKFEVKEVDEEQGVIIGYGSTFGGKPDPYNDIVDPGAFAKTIQENMDSIVSLAPNHDMSQPIGLPELREDKKGLYTKIKIVRGIQKAEETLLLAKAGVIKRMSIGYDAIKTEMIDGVRHLKEVRLWDVSPVVFAANSEALILAVKSVIPFNATTKAPEDEAWDGPAEVAAATVEDLAVMCAWVDSENRDLKTAYKLPHHKASHNVVWKGVAAAMAALLGARGGVDIPESDRKGVYNHLVKHYAQFEKEPPDFKTQSLDEILTEAKEHLKALQALHDKQEPAKSTPTDEESKEAAHLETIISGLKAENEGFDVKEAEERIEAILSKI